MRLLPVTDQLYRSLFHPQPAHTKAYFLLQPQALDRRNQIFTQKPHFQGVWEQFLPCGSLQSWKQPGKKAASPSPSQHGGWGRAEESFRDLGPALVCAAGGRWEKGGKWQNRRVHEGQAQLCTRRAPRLRRAAPGPCFTAFLCTTDPQGEKSMKAR